MAEDKKQYYELPPLPYARTALSPHISEELINFHYGKHHQAYVTNLNALAQTTESLRNRTYDDLVRNLEPGKPFNQAAQIWNHTFYWNSMSPTGGGNPTGEIAALINSSFGSFDNFKTQFSAEASGHFGSGWAWLVLLPDGKLSVLSTHDAGNPLAKNDGRGKPILTCDVWEHAYYIDFRNARPDYIKAWWNVINWEFANKNLKA